MKKKRKTKSKPKPKIIINPDTRRVNCSACGEPVTLVRKETNLFHQQGDTIERGGQVTIRFNACKLEVIDADMGRFVCQKCNFSFGRSKKFDVDYF